MSGPALRQPAAHHAIHQAAWQDAEEALELAVAMLAASRGDEFARMVEIFLEVVDTRILTHAQEEEAGLYREWRAEHAGWGGEVDALIREHDTLRELAAAAEQAMRGRDAVGAMSAMHRLLQASDLHARHEEEVLHRLAVRGAGHPVSVPLRWAHPESFEHLRRQADAAGVHPREYQVVVDTEGPLTLVVLRWERSEWRQAFAARELCGLGERVRAFFAECVEAMAVLTRATYDASMRSHGV